MIKTQTDNSSADLTKYDSEVILRLREAIAGGRNWYMALLEAIGRWSSAEEVYNERTYHYLIDDAAFDWQLLAERLCEAVDDLLPEQEKSDFLLKGKPPLELTKESFFQLIGEAKYRQYLNYFYGITVEEALLLAIKEEVRKERITSGVVTEEDTTAEAFYRIYGDTQTVLLGKFRKEKHHKNRRSIGLGELKEFTFWLFKYRVKNSDKSRVASDTKKALNWLNRNGYPDGFVITRPITGMRR